MKALERFAAVASRWSPAHVAAGIVLLLLFATLLRTAWLCDDYFITLRSVMNFVHGHGITWNPGERVQAFTHPLWMLLLSASVALTGEPFLTTLALCGLLSGAAIVAVARVPDATPWGVALAWFGLLCSNAFVDYATSGLENPLAYALLAGTFVALRRAESDASRPLAAAVLLAGLLFLTRMDLVLLWAPPLAWALYRAERLPWGALVLAAVPIAAWHGFALFYFGSPLPNTYYAKLGADVEISDRLAQSVHYFVNLFHRDPGSVGLLALGVTVAALRRRPGEWPWLVGIALHLVYVARIGGDFMAGRLFATPIFVAALLTAPCALVPRRELLPLLAAAAAMALALSPLQWGDDYRQRWSMGADHGIADERGFYYRRYGLLSPRRGWPDVSAWKEPTSRVPPPRTLCGLAGEAGLRAGPRGIVIDSCGLADPLLARLPVPRRPWRIGHWERHVPHGYEASLVSGANRLVDRRLARFYDRLRLITRAPLDAPGRLEAIVALNLGRYDRWIDRERYRQTHLPPPPGAEAW